MTLSRIKVGFEHLLLTPKSQTLGLRGHHEGQSYISDPWSASADPSYKYLLTIPHQVKIEIFLKISDPI